MSSDQSPTNKESLLMNFAILVVDDDPIVLSIVSAMLNSSKYKESYLVEITVTTVKNSIEALATLRNQRDNIDLVITDYHMPGMNGVELKKKIDEEFNQLPVIVMSSDMNNEIERETVSSGAMLFLTKPIKPKDLNNIWQYVLSSKVGKSPLMSTDQTIQDADNHDSGDDDDDDDHHHHHHHGNGKDEDGNDDDDNDNDGGNNNKKKKIGVVRRRRPSVTAEVIVPPPCDEEFMNSMSSGVNENNGERIDNVNDDNNGDNSKKEGRRRSDRKRSLDRYEEDNNDASCRPPAPKKAKVVWTNCLHNLFLQAIRHIGLEKAVPKKIQEFMSVPGLTRENIASHLQKYRLFLKKVAQRGIVQSGSLSGRAINSNFALGHFNSSSSSSYLHHQPSNTTFASSSSSSSSLSSSNSQLGLGTGGQSRLLTATDRNINLRSHHNLRNNPWLYHHLTFGTRNNQTAGRFTGSSPTQTEKEAWKSLFPYGTPSKIGSKTSHQVHRFGYYNPNNNNDPRPHLNTNLNQNVPTSSAYAGIRINDKGDLIGPLNINPNYFNSDSGSVNRNNSSSGRSHGSNNSTDQKNTVGSSPSLILSSTRLQTLVSNDQDQSHTDIASAEFNMLSISGCQQELELGGDENGLTGLPCDPSNFQLHHNQQQGDQEVGTQNLELIDNSIFEMNQILENDSVGENVGWACNNNVNIEGGSGGVTMNPSAAPVVYSPAAVISPNQVAEPVEDFMDIQLFDLQGWGDDDFMDYLFDGNDM